jgi:hypothetical protein
MVIIFNKTPQGDHRNAARMPQPRATRVRSTRQAAAVVAAMSAMTAFCGAQEICDAVRRAGVKVSAGTVYRHLRVLAGQGGEDRGSRPAYAGARAGTGLVTGTGG